MGTKDLRRRFTGGKLVLRVARKVTVEKNKNRQRYSTTLDLFSCYCCLSTEGAFVPLPPSTFVFRTSLVLRDTIFLGGQIIGLPYARYVVDTGQENLYNRSRFITRALRTKDITSALIEYAVLYRWVSRPYFFKRGTNKLPSELLSSQQSLPRAGSFIYRLIIPTPRPIPVRCVELEVGPDHRDQCTNIPPLTEYISCWESFLCS